MAPALSRSYTGVPSAIRNPVPTVPHIRSQETRWAPPSLKELFGFASDVNEKSKSGTFTIVAAIRSGRHIARNTPAIAHRRAHHVHPRRVDREVPPRPFEREPHAARGVVLHGSGRRRQQRVHSCLDVAAVVVSKPERVDIVRADEIVDRDLPLARLTRAC